MAIFHTISSHLASSRRLSNFHLLNISVAVQGNSSQVQGGRIFLQRCFWIDDRCDRGEELYQWKSYDIASRFRVNLGLYPFVEPSLTRKRNWIGALHGWCPYKGQVSRTKDILGLSPEIPRSKDDRYRQETGNFVEIIGRQLVLFKGN